MLGLFGCKDGNKKNDSKTGKEAFALIDTIKKYPDCKIFNINNSDDENSLKWKIQPTSLQIIPDEEGHFLVKAKIIDNQQLEESGYINLSTPERIADYVIYNFNNPQFDNIYELKGKDVIPTVASDCFGLYELYYSKNNPDIGIEILKSGLDKSHQKNVIAEDLGYILRDENRLEEALEYFLISEQNEPSSEYIYSEIEGIYHSLGNDEKAEEYKLKFEKN